MQGLPGYSQDLGLDAKNNGKPGNGFEQGCGVVRFASVEEHPPCTAEKEWRRPKGHDETRQEASP